MLGIRPRDIVRKAEAAAAKIDPAKLDEKRLLAAMVKHPELIERPIVVNNGKAVLGRPPENVLDII
jgi:arsenate reductase